MTQRQLMDMNTLARLHFSGGLTAAALLIFSGCSSDTTMLERTVTSIGSSGGQAVSANGEVTIEFPAGALSVDTDISIATRRGVGDTSLVSPVFDFGPDGTTFEQPVKVSLTSETIDNVLIAQVDVDGSPIEFLDTVANGSKLEATLDHFSSYAALSSAVSCSNLACGDTCLLCPPGAQGCMEPAGPRVCSPGGGCLPASAVVCTNPPVDAGPLDTGSSNDAGNPPVDAGQVDASNPMDAGPVCPPTVTVTEMQRNRKADVLVVLDASGSMVDSKASLLAEIDKVHAELINLQVDAKIGFVATPTPPGMMGVTTVPNSTSGVTLSQVMDIPFGVSGEQLFDVSLEALSGPTPFSRPDAHLLLILLADEDDQSQITATQLVSVLRSSKDARYRNAITLNAIDGGANGCSGPGGSAQASTRIDTAVGLLGGSRNDICQPPYNAALTSYGNGFGLNQRFGFGGATPASIDSNTIVVSVNGVTAPAANWAFVSDPGEPAFVEFVGQSIPGPGDTVEISYEPTCN